MRKYILAILAILLLSACGNGYIYEPPEEELTDRTLSVLAPRMFIGALRQTAREISEIWSEQEREFTLELTAYSAEDRETMLTRLQTMLMAGEGYDMFFWDGHPVGLHAASGLFADFYELMDRHPGTDRGDFFTGALEAWEIDGGLYVFPLSVEFTYVGISANLPEHIIADFKRRDSISMPELMRIYLEIHSAYRAEFGHMGFEFVSAFGLGGYGFLSDFNLMQVVGSFIDFDSGTSFLNDTRFVQYLEDKRSIIEMRIATGIGVPSRQDWLSEIAGHYVFFFTRQWANDVVYTLFDAPEPAFEHFIPIADVNGRLIIEQSPSLFGMDSAPFWGSVAINAGGDSMLAWEFTRHLASVMPRHDMRDIILDGAPHDYHWWFGPRILISPIERSLLVSHMNAYFYRTFEDVMTMDRLLRNYLGIPMMPEERRRTFDDAIARLMAFNDSPSVVVRYLPASLYMDTINEFMMGMIIAQQAAEELNSRVGLWLIE